jgi:hypothetical protein
LNRTIFGIGFQNLHDIGYQVRQLLVELDFFLIVTDAITLGPRFVRNALNVRLHDANVIVEKMDALTELSNAHVTRLVVLDLGFFALSSPDVVSFQVIVIGTHDETIECAVRLDICLQ